MKKKWWLAIAIAVVVILVVAILVMMLSGGDSSKGKIPGVSGEGQSTIVVSGEQTAIKDATIKVDEFVVENLSLNYEDGYTFIQGDICNNSETDYLDGASFNISLYENEKLLITFPVRSSTLRANERSSFNAQLTMDCTLATDIIIDFVESK